jgi:hypothetical protein
MTVIDVVAMPSSDVAMGDPYDYSRLSDNLRSKAMLAQGTVVQGLSSAVKRVLDAGQALSWAKAELPHGEYLPWVQQACGLKPQYATKLIKAAEWANVAHEQHLDQITDANTLFLLSADTTTDEVREWFMERAAAGEPPSRREVQERKRSASEPRQPQPTEALALNLIRKGEVERVRAALALAEQAQELDAAAVMAEFQLRQLPKGSVIRGVSADFFKLKDERWVRMPHATQMDVVPEPAVVSAPDIPAQAVARVRSIEQAAIELGLSVNTVSQRFSPKQMQEKGPWTGNGLRATRFGVGLIRIEQVNE